MEGLILKTTQEYFNADIETLVSAGNDYGYTIEECKLFDEGLKVHFCEDIEEYEREKEKIIHWYKYGPCGLDFDKALRTINGRIAMIFN